MAAKLANPLRVLGLYLLYAVAGVVILVALAASADVGADSGEKSPTSWPAKVVSALSGVAFLAAGLGMYMSGDPAASQEWASRLTMGGWSIGGVLALCGLVLVGMDLQR